MKKTAILLGSLAAMGCLVETGTEPDSDLAAEVEPSVQTTSEELKRDCFWSWVLCERGNVGGGLMEPCDMFYRMCEEGYD